MRRAIGWALVAAVLPLAAAAQETIHSHGISPFGNLKYPPDFKHFDYVNPDAPKGGTMIFRGTLAVNTFDSLNPFILAGDAAQGLERTYDALLAPAYDEAGAYYGLLAESLEYPEDRSWVIFTLRPEAKFNDGTPVTAEDVVYTVETLKEEGHPYYGITLENVESVEALDDRNVKFTFTEGAPTRDMPAEVGTLSIIPKHYWEEEGHDFAKSSLDIPVSSGPYKVDRINPGHSIRYCRDPGYWGADLPVNVGTNNFDCYTYEYFADTTAAFEALKTGEYLFHEEYSSAIWGTGYDFPALEKGWVKQEEIPDGRPSGTQGFFFNMRHEKLQDPRVREALAILFNFEWSNESLFHGLYTRTDSFFENSDMQAEGLPEGEELAALEPYRDQLPATIFTEPPYEPPVQSTSQIDRSTLRKAGTLLEEAGWEVGSDGMRRKDGQVLTLEFVDDNPGFERIITPYIQNLRQAGVDAEYELIDPAQMERRQNDFDYDVMSARLPINISPSTELRTFFGSKGRDANGTLNFAGVADPVVDGLIEAVISAESREQMVARVKALDRVLRSKQIWAPNWYRDSYWVAYWDVFGRPDVQPPYDRGVDFWWWDQSKFEALRAQGALTGLAP